MTNRARVSVGLRRKIIYVVQKLGKNGVPLPEFFSKG